jgi:hypothetical protein
LAAEADGIVARPRIKSAAFSAIMIVGMFVLPLTSRGMIEVSTTRSPSRPSTFPYSREQIATDFAGIPEAEVSQMVSGNAARLYGLTEMCRELEGQRHWPPFPRSFRQLAVMR